MTRRDRIKLELRSRATADSPFPATRSMERELRAAFLFDDPVCRRCGCTDSDFSACVARTGAPCVWVEPDLCSACAFDAVRPTYAAIARAFNVPPAL